MTDEEVRYVHFVLTVVEEAIEALGSVPSGHLYARLAGHLTLSQYEAVISLLIEQKKVRRDRSHLLTWIGPAARS